MLSLGEVMGSPLDCPHADVLVDVEMTAERWHGMPLDPDALLQRGRCKACGLRVMRRGRQDAWPAWQPEPTERYRWGQTPV
jgi:hypothetical protein